jgi:hypothetical protein
MEEYQLGSLLPPETVTYDDKNTQSCIDLCYGTQELVDRVVKCGVDYEMDHNSDHLPITYTFIIRMRATFVEDCREYTICLNIVTL